MTYTNPRLPLTERAELFRERWLPEDADSREFETSLVELLISVRDDFAADLAEQRLIAAAYEGLADDLMGATGTDNIADAVKAAVAAVEAAQ
ncbi:hypothetical protein ACHMW5_13590 [Azospirillum melinis]|uniref:hypothetical protein n=1 Tax=Azospirillum melinis TaxID=328839 RepID=UPI003756679C